MASAAVELVLRRLGGGHSGHSGPWHWSAANRHLQAEDTGTDEEGDTGDTEEGATGDGIAAEDTEEEDEPSGAETAQQREALLSELEDGARASLPEEVRQSGSVTVAVELTRSLALTVQWPDFAALRRPQQEVVLEATCCAL